MSQPTAEQMQFAAAMNFMERQVANVAREGANVMVQLEVAAQRIKALEAPKTDALSVAIAKLDEDGKTALTKLAIVISESDEPTKKALLAKLDPVGNV